MRARRYVTSFALVLLATCVAATVAAGPFDKRTSFTFNTPVAVPGVTLPAGTYVFRLADEIVGREVIQVFSADGRTNYASFFALRTARPEPAANKPEIRFLETASDMPAAVQSWWYPSERDGYEFVYPREQAWLLANGSGRSVLAINLAPGEGEPAITRVAPAETAVAPAAPVAAEAPVVIGEVVEEAPAAQEPAPAPLPKSDSPTATVVLLGFLSLLAAFAVRAARTAGA